LRQHRRKPELLLQLQLQQQLLLPREVKRHRGRQLLLHDGRGRHRALQQRCVPTPAFLDRARAGCDIRNVDHNGV
jgi:hypothetical protein